MPAIRVIVFERLLNPLEYLEERFKLNLAICEVDVFEAALVSFTPTFRLNQDDKNSQVRLK